MGLILNAQFYNSAFILWPIYNSSPIWKNTNSFYVSVWKMNIMLATVTSEIYHTRGLEFRENCSKNTNAPFYFADVSRVAEYFSFN